MQEQLSHYHIKERFWMNKSL